MEKHMIQKSSRSLCFFCGENSSSELKVRSCGNFVLVPPDREQIRVIDFGEIYWPISGRCCFLANGVKHILRPGNVWYSPPGTEQNFYPLETCHYCWLTIAGKEAGLFFRLLNVSPGLNRAGICPEYLFNELGTKFSPLTAEHRIAALSIAFRIVALCSLRNHGRHIKRRNVLEEAREQIRLNFSDPDLSIASLAAGISMPCSSFNRAFRKNYGETVSEYLTHCRMQRAIELLNETSFPIAEIARECGFASANYFTKVFRRQLGIAPGRYCERYSSFSPQQTKQETP